MFINTDLNLFITAALSFLAKRPILWSCDNTIYFRGRPSYQTWGDDSVSPYIHRLSTEQVGVTSRADIVEQVFQLRSLLSLSIDCYFSHNVGAPMTSSKQEVSGYVDHNVGMAGQTEWILVGRVQSHRETWVDERWFAECGRQWESAHSTKTLQPIVLLGDWDMGLVYQLWECWWLAEWAVHYDPNRSFWSWACFNAQQTAILCQRYCKSGIISGRNI